jgi:RNA recognition motif-containing protein
VRSYSPKYSSRLPVFQRAAGEFINVVFSPLSPNKNFRIVEFASHEDSQRAIRELSEQPLLGRPVFIREVSFIHAIIS